MSTPTKILQEKNRRVVLLLYQISETLQNEYDSIGDDYPYPERKEEVSQALDLVIQLVAERGGFEPSLIEALQKEKEVSE